MVLNLELSRTSKGWFIKKEDLTWGPSPLLPSHIGDEFRNIAEFLGIQSKEEENALAQLIWKTKISIEQGKGELTLETEVTKKRKVKVRAVRNETPLTGWVTLDSIEKLRTSRNAKTIRDLLKEEQPGWDMTVEDTIKRVQSYVESLKDKETEVDVDASGNYFDFRGDFIPKLLADEIMSQHRFVTMMDNEDVYIHLDGFYQTLGEVLIKKECKDRLLDEYRKNRATEVIDYIKVSTYIQRKEEPPNLIPLENGVLDLELNELRPYTSDFMFFNKIPVNYDPEADCPLIKKFHKEITSSEEDITILEEVLGFCLYRDYFIAKALMLAGGGSNGKSTWLALAKSFLGKENVSGRSLQDLEEHRFAKADLHTKLTNIYADLPDKALFRTGMFKMLTGRDLIAAEKKHRDTFHFVNYAKLMFSANKVPESPFDNSEAFFRRWIIIVFPNVFTGEDADPQILDKLTTEEELSGLLNLALAGLKRLLKNGVFSHSKTTEEIKEDYIRKSSPIAAFAMDCLETDSDAFIVKKELFNVFAEYCRQLKLPTVTQDTFFKNLPQHAVVMDYRPTVEKRRYYTFKGIRYSLGTSNLSMVSRVFYTVAEKKDDYKDYEIEELKDDKFFIAVRIPLDTIDSPDKEKQEPGAPTTCWICHRALPSDLKNTTVEDGKTVHVKCARKLKEGRRKGE